MAKSKLVPAVIIGAVVGAVVSMFDKKTREHTVQTASKVKETVVYYSQNHDELQNLIDTKMQQVQSISNTVEKNVQSFLGDGKEVKSLPETIFSLVSETKEAFSKNQQ